MTKPIGARCNLECRYCYYLEKQPAFYPHSGVPRMTDATLERFIRDYIASQPGEEVTFSWQGGEPTMLGRAFFERALEFQQRYAAGRRVANAFQTNGTLLDDAWGEFLARHRFLVGLSIDGPKAMHDGYRVVAGGGPTWDKVMRGLRILRQHRVEFNTLTVVHRRNAAHAKEVYEFLRGEGVRFMQFIPLVERKPATADVNAKLAHGMPSRAPETLVAAEHVAEVMAPECAAPDAFGKFLIAIFEHWSRRDIGTVFVQHFDVALSAWCGHGAPLCVFQERCGGALALEHNGDVYACDHYVYPQYKLGNLHEVPLSDLGHGTAAHRFGDAKAALPEVCRSCSVRFVCNGDCPKHRVVRAKPGEPGLSYLCPSYKLFFNRIRPAMETMAALLRAGRAPAEFMHMGRH